MKNITKFIGLFLSLFILITTTEVLVKADNQSNNNFSISPLNPDTGQPQSTYYDLNVKPNELKDLKVRIFNSSDKDIKVNINANTATTNENGVISYAGQESQDSSMKFPFAQIATLDKKIITIPKNSSYDATIHLKVPSQKFNGVILGGIRVTGVSTETQTKNAPAVKANVAYSVAVMMRENLDNVDPSMHLLGVKKEVRDYKNYISAELQNSAPRLIKKLETDARVYKKGSKKLLYEANKSEMEMAPNSKFNFGISLEDHAFKSGTYTIKVSGKADGKPYSFEKDFTITAQEAKTYNKNAIYAKEEAPDYTNLILVIGVTLAVLFLVLIFILLKNKRKGDK